MIDMKPPKLVVVTWLDAVFRDADFSSGEATHTGIVTVHVGWLIKKDRVGITLAMSYCPADGETGEHMFIPAGMVKSVRAARY